MKRLLVLLLLLLPAMVRAQDLPMITANPDRGTAEEFAGCSLACGLGWTLQASSALPPQKGNRYDAACAEDANARTCWASRGAGEWLEFRFTREGKDAPAAGPVGFRGIRLMNGYAKSPELWKANARVKTLRMDLNGVAVRRLRLLDRNGVQALLFPDLQVERGDVLRLTVLDTYPGQKYQDTCLTEIVLDGGH